MGGTPAVFPNTVGVQALGLSWQLKWSRDGRHADTQVGWSGTKVYRAAAAPATHPLFETLLQLGCRAASGLTGDDEPALVDAIWSEFADRDVRRVDGVRMGYYRDILCAGDTNVIDSAGLLTATNGQCGSWVSLMRGVIAAHGIASTQHIILRPRNAPSTPLGCRIAEGVPVPRPSIPGLPDGALGFLVHNYQIMGQGASGCPAYPLRFNDPCLYFAPWPMVDVSDQTGHPGQDAANPASWFSNHQIVK